MFGQTMQKKVVEVEDVWRALRMLLYCKHWTTLVRCQNRPPAYCRYLPRHNLCCCDRRGKNSPG